MLNSSESFDWSIYANSRINVDLDQEILASNRRSRKRRNRNCRPAEELEISAVLFPDSNLMKLLLDLVQH